jgi:succinyl-CoA synthetase alpha subunit
MKISDKVRRISSGIAEASVIMATPTNKGILIRLGFSPTVIEEAKESDIIIAVRAQDQDSLNLAIMKANEMLESPEKISAGDEEKSRFTDLDSALNAMPDANLVLLSIPGEHVKDISLKLIDRRIHQQIFSDHVPIEDELEIKERAVKNDVLILGPGAGTSIINGKGIGFSNAVKEGPVGVVAAAGTGLQEVITLLDHCGIGVKHGLGVGGSDPKEKIGGLMMLECIKLLEKDPDIEVIGIVSKPPFPSIQEKIIKYISQQGKKKYVLAFIGGRQMQDDRTGGRIIQVGSLATAVLAFAKQAGNDQFLKARAKTSIPQKDLVCAMEKEWIKLSDGQKYIRALYTGGTFTYEAQVILSGILPGPIYSNAPILNIKEMASSLASEANSIVDLGEEEFTQGRPHPMIDPTIRKLRILEEAKDPEVGVLLMDFVLGYGSHPDPVGAALREIKEARDEAARDGRYLSVISHVCGTTGDPQGYDSSISKLQSAGSIVLPTNAIAAVGAALVALRGKVDLEKIYSQYLTLGGEL